MQGRGRHFQTDNIMMIIRWFCSRTARQASAMRRHVWKMLQHQRDILKPDSVHSIQGGLAAMSSALKSGASKAELKREMGLLEDAANRYLRPYPNPNWRENVEVLLVALAVALGIRTFFLQPFKIPTGSMQPTLFGIVSEPLAPDFKIPTGLERIRQGLAGVSYVHFVADAQGRLERLYPPVGIGKQGSIFRIYQKFDFAGKTHTLWFPPDCGTQRLDYRAGIQPGQVFKRGQDVFKLAVRSGDHLFVDRVSYNFRKPLRGETIVFETKGILTLPQDQFYIKRLVGMSGETIQIGDDRHLLINRTNRLDASTPHFEFVYGFNPKVAPADSQYSGHVNQAVYRSVDGINVVAPLFPTSDAAYQIPTDQFMVMGDNTMNSLDSRAWGTFPARNVIGKSCFVYWPLSGRFGWGQR